MEPYGWSTEEEEYYDPKGKEETSSDEEEVPLLQPGRTNKNYAKRY